MPSLVFHDDDDNDYHYHKRIVLLFDLDCFYAQCERVRLGLPVDVSIALLQWNAVLAVSYPARKCGIQRGDSWDDVAQKSKGTCWAIHLKIIEKQQPQKQHNIAVPTTTSTTTAAVSSEESSTACSMAKPQTAAAVVVPIKKPAKTPPSKTRFSTASLAAASSHTVHLSAHAVDETTTTSNDDALAASFVTPLAPSNKATTSSKSISKPPLPTGPPPPYQRHSATTLAFQESKKQRHHKQRHSSSSYHHSAPNVTPDFHTIPEDNAATPVLVAARNQTTLPRNKTKDSQQSVQKQKNPYAMISSSTGGSHKDEATTTTTTTPKHYQELHHHQRDDTNNNSAATTPPQRNVILNPYASTCTTHSKKTTNSTVGATSRLHNPYHVSSNKQQPSKTAATAVPTTTETTANLPPPLETSTSVGGVGGKDDDEKIMGPSKQTWTVNPYSVSTSTQQPSNASKTTSDGAPTSKEIDHPSSSLHQTTTAPNCGKANDEDVEEMTTAETKVETENDKIPTAATLPTPNNHDNNDHNETSDNNIGKEESNIVDLEQAYNQVYRLSHAEQLEARKERDVRRNQSDGKACLERYRLASSRIFKVVLDCLRDRLPGKDQFCLEKASIDEFYLDITNYCYQTQNQKQHDDDDDVDHKTKIVGKNKTHHSNNNDGGIQKALDRACLVAHWIRTDVWNTLGFTMSAGISTNKMMAKLAASYGKPDGQAVLHPDDFDYVMDETKLKKVRNFGGKLGKQVLQILAETTGQQKEAPKMGDLRQVPLTVLQQRLSEETAQFVFDSCRGIDREAVKESLGALVKSITAFKTFPSTSNTTEIHNWVQLLATEIVTRVAQDVARHGRYPKSCTLNFSYYNNGAEKPSTKSRQRPKTRSIRLVYPPPCSTKMDSHQQQQDNHQPKQQQDQNVKIEKLVDQAKEKLIPILAEHRITGVGLSVGNFESFGKPPEGVKAIDKFFSKLKPTTQGSKSSSLAATQPSPFQGRKGIKSNFFSKGVRRTQAGLFRFRTNHRNSLFFSSSPNNNNKTQDTQHKQQEGSPKTSQNGSLETASIPLTRNTSSPIDLLEESTVPQANLQTQSTSCPNPEHSPCKASSKRDHDTLEQSSDCLPPHDKSDLELAPARPQASVEQINDNHKPDQLFVLEPRRNHEIVELDDDVENNGNTSNSLPSENTKTTQEKAPNPDKEVVLLDIDNSSPDPLSHPHLDDNQDKDHELARELQAAFDREQRPVINSPWKRKVTTLTKKPHRTVRLSHGSTVRETSLTSSTSQPSPKRMKTSLEEPSQKSPPNQQPDEEDEVVMIQKNEGASSHHHHRHNPDKDLQLARKLQASFDRENYILSRTSQVSSIAVGGVRPPAKKKIKTTSIKRIDAFFGKK